MSRYLGWKHIISLLVIVYFQVGIQEPEVPEIPGYVPGDTPEQAPWWTPGDRYGWPGGRRRGRY